jgi:hypothetical protein
MTNPVQRFAIAMLAVCVVHSATAEVKLTAATRKNFGVEIVALATTSVPKTWHATAQVLDPAALIAQLSDIRAAELQAKTSRNEAERLSRLYEADSNISLKILEAARAQSAADRAKLDSLRAQWLTGYGRALAALGDSERERLSNDLLAGTAVLARAETLQSVPSAAVFKSGRVRELSGDASWNAQVLGPAALANQSMGNAYLLKIPAALQPGTLLEAELNDAKSTLQGIKVPRSAVIRWQGSNWAYVETEPNTFERVALTPVAWIDDGCLVQQGLTPGSKVVSVGAALLLAAETRSAEE